MLTDEQFFQGSLENLEIASEATRLPCLRKDFIVDEFQLLEARAHRADAVLLIVAALTQTELISLHRRARELELDVFARCTTARSCSAPSMPAANHRREQPQPAYFPRRSEHVAAAGRADASRSAEGGGERHRERRRHCTVAAAGFDAFLVGESLMRAPHPGEALRKLLNAASAFDMLPSNASPVGATQSSPARSRRRSAG